MYNNGGNREQKRSGQELQAGGQENPKRSLSSSPGPRNNRVGSGSWSSRVEPSQVKARQGKSRTSRSTSKQSKEASRRKYFKKGGCGGRRGRARICAFLMLCTSLGPSASKQAQGRIEQGRVESKGGRKQVVSIWKEGMYVWMEVRRYVCINVTYCEIGQRWSVVAGLTSFQCFSLAVCVSLGGRQTERGRESHVSACCLGPRSLLLAQYRYRYGPWYRYWGRVRGTWVPGQARVGRPKWFRAKW